MSELFENAVTGVNIIPTVLLGLIIIYWITVILGALDIDFLDIDLDGAENTTGPFYAVLAFLNIVELPLMFVLSMIILIFWIIAMLMYYLPVPVGGVENAILFIPALILSMVVTKIITQPMKNLFSNSFVRDNRINQVVGQSCTLMCNVENGRLGQAKVKGDGASIVINVKSENGEAFQKNEIACVISKDLEKNIYYINKY